MSVVSFNTLAEPSSEMLLTWVCFEMMKKGKRRFRDRHSGFDEIVARLLTSDQQVTYSCQDQRSQSVQAFEEMSAQWLREAYFPSLLKTQTHTGYVNQDSERPAQESDVRGRPLQTMARTMSTVEPELELDSGPFFDRSATFLRLKRPHGTGRGYARKQPFKAHDIRVWERIRDWQQSEADEIDLLCFINYWFECDFSWQALEHLFALDPETASFDATLAGDAQPCGAVVEACIDGPLVQVEWSCQVCTEDGRPTLNSINVPSKTQGDDSFLSHDFCRRCQTYRHDRAVWHCKVQGRTWPRAKPCRQAMKMSKSPVGVPCCSICGNVRHKFQYGDDEGGIFDALSNLEEEPLPQRGMLFLRD